MHKGFVYISIMASLALASCGDDGVDNTLSNTSVYDFVTLEAKGDDGSTFTLRKSGDSELITYTSSFSFANDTTINCGDRLIIKYLRTDGQPYTSGPITLSGYRYLDNYPQMVVNDNSDGIDEIVSEPLKVTSMTRTGQYINMQAQLSCQVTDNPALLCMCTDEEKIDDPMPVLRILYLAAQPGENYMTGYCSWDISAIWDRDTCQGVEIQYVTPAGTASQSFLK